MVHVVEYHVQVYGNPFYGARQPHLPTQGSAFIIPKWKSRALRGKIVNREYSRFSMFKYVSLEDG